MLQVTDRGLWCEAADLFIDPWRPVERAVVTHAHGDHLAWGCRRYLMAADGRHVARARLGAHADRLETRAWGEPVTVNGVRISLHPAGHILGSAQVRLEHRGEVWVVSGDYKVDPDPTCAPWEPVRCHTFITESTFGLPIYRWPEPATVAAEINAWWRANADRGVTSVLLGYALGKAQRLLAMLDPGIGPILTHGAVERMTEGYRASGVSLPPTRHASADMVPASRRRGTPSGGTEAPATARAIVIAPPSVVGSRWLARFGPVATAFASGWMQVRGARRRRGVARGFVVSDHVDWPQLLGAIDATGAARVWVTHGFSGVMVRWLGERGLDARAISTRWEGERDDQAVDEPETVAPPTDVESTARVGTVGAEA